MIDTIFKLILLFIIIFSFLGVITYSDTNSKEKRESRLHLVAILIASILGYVIFAVVDKLF